MRPYTCIKQFSLSFIILIGTSHVIRGGGGSIRVGYYLIIIYSVHARPYIVGFIFKSRV